MKLSLKHVLLLTALAVATQPNLILASEDSAAVSSDAVADAAAEAKVEEAVEAAVDASTGDVVVEDDATDDDDGGGDAGKECAADDCSSDTTATVSETTDEAEAEEEDPKCPSRPHVIRCAAKYLDTNHNGALEREELESVMNSVPWLLRSEYSLSFNNGSVVHVHLEWMLAAFICSILINCKPCSTLLYSKHPIKQY
jgi:hypothetical protein